MTLRSPAGTPRSTGRHALTRIPAAPGQPAADWDALLPDSVPGFYLSHDWLESIRGRDGYDDSTWLITDEDQRIVGLVPVYTASEPANNPLYDLGALFGGASPGRSASWNPQVIIGARAGYANAPLARDALALPAWAAAAARAVTESTCRSAAIPFLGRQAMLDMSGFFPGQPALLSGGRCQVPLGGEDFEDHLSRLPASRRAIIRRDLRAFSRSGATIRTQPLDVADIGTLAPLLVNVQHRHGSAVTTEHVAGYLRQCAAGGLHRRSILFTCHHEGDLVGFSLGYVFGSSLIMRVVGLDYLRTGDSAGYFSLLMHEPVRYACRSGLAAVDLGTEGYRTKLLRGAELVPLWSLLLASPSGWDPAAADAHNAGLAGQWADAFGDLVPDLATRCALPQSPPGSAAVG